MNQIVIRPIRIEGNVAYIPLTQGYEAIIDAADVALVGGFNWHANAQSHTVYAVRFEQRGGKRAMVRLHRAILGAPVGMNGDHVDGDGLNNRRSNLRLATKTENNRNARRSVRNTSGFKGVSWDKPRRKWRADIKVSGRSKHVGYFDTPKAAHAAYCEAATRLHGEFARTA